MNAGSQGHKQQILKMRAEKLAKSFGNQESPSDFLEAVVFNLSEEKYGIETKYVAEVFPLKNCTPLPGAPAYVHGLTNVRRKIYLIIDLKVFFSLVDAKVPLENILILKDREREFAVLAEGSVYIRQIPKDELQTLPTLVDVRQDFLKGLTTDGTVILDGEKIINSPRLIVNELMNV